MKDKDQINERLARLRTLMDLCLMEVNELVEKHGPEAYYSNAYFDAMMGYKNAQGHVQALLWTLGEVDDDEP